MQTNNATTIGHVTEADGNLYADLGFSPEDAAQFQSESDARIATRQALKMALMEEVDAWIKREKITQMQAAGILHISRPRVTDIVNRKTDKFSIDNLIDLVGRLGLKVQLSIS